VLARDGIVFALGHLLRHRAAVLLRHVEEAGFGGREKLDLDGRSLGHGTCPSCIWKTYRLWRDASPAAEFAATENRCGPNVKSGPGFVGPSRHRNFTIHSVSRRAGAGRMRKGMRHGSDIRT